jgi:hypothetical protein
MSQAPEINAEQKQRAETSLHDLPFARLMGMRLVDLRHNEAVIKIDMRDDLRQPAGVLHGGVTATLIDTAMAFAVITRLAPDERASTVAPNRPLPPPAFRRHIHLHRKSVACGQKDIHGLGRRRERGGQTDRNRRFHLHKGLTQSLVSHFSPGTYSRTSVR